MNELTGTVPRDVRLTGAGAAVAVVASALAAGALVSAIVMSIAIARAADRGAPVRADAETVDVRRVRGEHPRRVVTYRFDASGRRYEGRTSLPEDDRREHSRGARIPIEYVASAPAANWIVGYEPGVVPPFVIPLVSGGLLAIAALIAWRLRRQWQLLSEGRAALARVTGFRNVRQDKHTAFEVTCTFQDLSGASRRLRYHVPKAPPAAGTTVPIVYHRDNPRWNAVYPLRFVRPLRAPSRAPRRDHAHRMTSAERRAQR